MLNGLDHSLSGKMYQQTLEGDSSHHASDTNDATAYGAPTLRSTLEDSSRTWRHDSPRASRESLEALEDLIQWTPRTSCASASCASASCTSAPLVSRPRPHMCDPIKPTGPIPCGPHLRNPSDHHQCDTREYCPSTETLTYQQQPTTTHNNPMAHVSIILRLRGVDTPNTTANPATTNPATANPADHGSNWKTWEDEMVLRCVEYYGPKWREIADQLPGRSDNSCRNRYWRVKSSMTTYGAIVDRRKTEYRKKTTCIRKSKKTIRKIKSGTKTIKPKNCDISYDTVSEASGEASDENSDENSNKSPFESPFDDAFFNDTNDTFFLLDELTPGDFEMLGLDNLVPIPSPQINYQTWYTTMASASCWLDDELLDALLTGCMRMF